MRVLKFPNQVVLNESDGPAASATMMEDCQMAASIRNIRVRWLPTEIEASREISTYVLLVRFQLHEEATECMGLTGIA